MTRVVGALIERRGVAIEDRAAEGDVLGRVAVAAHCEMSPGHHELERAFAGVAENGETLGVAVAPGVVVELLVDPRDPGGVVEAFEDLADDALLRR